MENKNFKEDFLNIRILINNSDFKSAELAINQLESLNKIKKISLLILKRDLYFFSNNLLKAYLISKEIILFFENIKTKLPKKSKHHHEYRNSLYVSINYHYSKKHYDRVIKDINKVLEIETYIDNLLIISKIMMNSFFSLNDFTNHSKWSDNYNQYLEILFEKSEPMLLINQYLPYEMINKESNSKVI
ncbi:MAG: hypothetical protein WC867_02905 [Candidatus Pacearchaeota archaeon]|jgi:hypothetical protein